MSLALRTSDKTGEHFCYWLYWTGPCYKISQIVIALIRVILLVSLLCPGSLFPIEKIGSFFPCLIMELMRPILYLRRHGCSGCFTISMMTIMIPCNRITPCHLERPFTRSLVFDPHNNQGGGVRYYPRFL